MISAELAEIRTLSDRAIVLYEGQISGTVDMHHFDEQEIGLMMTGQYQNDSSSRNLRDLLICRKNMK